MTQIKNTMLKISKNDCNEEKNQPFRKVKIFACLFSLREFRSTLEIAAFINFVTFETHLLNLLTSEYCDAILFLNYKISEILAAIEMEILFIGAGKSGGK